MISLRDVVTGFGNRDPLAEVWWRNLRGGGGGSAVITGVPPLLYIGDGRPLTDYLISGNTFQDGTPSPEEPVEVRGCGVRTGNLWDPDSKTTNQAGKEQYGVVLPAGVYTIVNNSNASIYRRDGVDSADATTFAAAGATNTRQFNTSLVAWTPYKQTQIMLNLGYPALPYEPYGYKLPLTVNGTEYPIYLGQVETTRRIKKLVLTGEETVRKDTNSGSSARYYIAVSDIEINTTNLLSSHFTYSPWYEPGTMKVYVSTVYFSMASSRYPEIADFKSYLAAQYAAGTPVTVWYVLAEPETGIVNEPLMKIGDYADTISFAQAGVTIPTVNGENVLDVPTEVKPSEVTIKGGISSV